MAELWDIYDENRNKTGRFAERGVYQLKKGEYHIVAVALILNSKKEMLITKRAPTKKAEPLKWELPGGSIIAGETSQQGILREIKEEIGLTFTPQDATFLTTIKRDVVTQDFKDIWLFKKDIDLNELEFADGEVIDAKWVTIDELLKLKEKRETVSVIDFGMEEYKLVLQK